MKNFLGEIPKIVQRAWKASVSSLNPSAKKVVDTPENRIARARIELEKAQRNGDINRAAELMYGVIPSLEQKLEGAETLKANVNRPQRGRQPSAGTRSIG
jgi:hypothetical protein